jgi:hypothetical protein
MTETSRQEEFKISGSEVKAGFKDAAEQVGEELKKVFEKVRAEGKIRRVIVKNKDGKVLVDLPALTAGAIGAVGILVAPIVSILVAVGGDRHGIDGGGREGSPGRGSASYRLTDEGADQGPPLCAHRGADRLLATDEEDRAHFQADPLQVFLGFDRFHVVAVVSDVDVLAVSGQAGPIDLAEQQDIFLQGSGSRRPCNRDGCSPRVRRSGSLGKGVIYLFDAPRT